MNQRPVPRFATLALLLGASALPAKAQQRSDAQPDAAAGTLDEVVVTARKRAEPLQDIPLVVNALSAEQIERSTLQNLADVSLRTPGLNYEGYVSAGLSGGLVLRGLTNTQLTNRTQNVAVFYDGVYLPNQAMFDLGLADIERIEVLKGPGSALYGRSEPGGTINLVTKKPKFDTEGMLELAVGRWNTYRVAGDYTTGLSDNVAVRINGAYEDADSFRDYIHTKKYAVTPSVLFKIGDSAVVTYELELVKQESPFDRGIVAPRGVLGAVPVSRFLGEPADGDTEVKATGHQLALAYEFNAD